LRIINPCAKSPTSKNSNFMNVWVDNGKALNKFEEKVNNDAFFDPASLYRD